jgi:hypothetical protein
MPPPESSLTELVITILNGSIGRWHTDYKVLSSQFVCCVWVRLSSGGLSAGGRFFLCFVAAIGGAKFAVALSGFNKMIVFENSISQASSLARTYYFRLIAR